VAERAKRTRSRARLWLRYLVVGLALVFFLFPIYWIAISALKQQFEYMASPPVWIPQYPTLNNIWAALARRGLLALRNSLLVAGAATALALAVGSLAAYALARYGTGGRPLLLWLLWLRLVPPIVLVMPVFLAVSALGLMDTLGPLIAVYTLFSLPFVAWILRSYFLEIPQEVEESALVDGASRLQVLWRVTLPLTLPGLIAAATFAFIFNWSEYLFAVTLSRIQAFTLPVAVAGFGRGQGAAMSVIATLPLFALGLLVQKQFVRGLTLGAVRG
jgi:multiple sugar transport system permease protein